ncbi:MAG: zinc metalloprotease HtpX [Candidatus Omnitrophica bacterium]|nr:zinc metalloprotease HtpX [Candidatus Omnitrophota bacterium]
MNYFKTGILLVVLTLLFIWVGGLIGGRQGAQLAFVIALVMNMVSYWFSDKIVLAMYRARPASEGEYPELLRIVRELTQEAGLPMPKVYVIPHASPNAFATGRNPKNAVVCVTNGIMDVLSYEELKGVVAHELGHVKNRDILIMSVTATIAGAIMMLADMARWAAMFGGSRSRNNKESGSNAIGFLVAIIIAPLAAMLIQLAISRSREYTADSDGARLAHSPMGLANALRKLDEASRVRVLRASPQTAHMFIVNPLSGEFFATLFSTHPPIKERIKRLEQMVIG